MNSEKKSILLEIQYFAPVQYYSKMLAFPELIIEQHEHYTKGSFRNRTVVAMSNGPFSLSIPLEKGKNQQSDIRDVRPDYSQDWQKAHFRTIKTAYGSAPYYEHYEPYIEKLLQKKPLFLFDYCFEIQTEICRLLKLKANINMSETYRSSYDSEILDFRNSIGPKTYMDSSWDPNFKPAVYPQVFEERNGFLPNLSILDLLFCTGPEGLYYLNKSVIK